MSEAEPSSSRSGKYRGRAAILLAVLAATAATADKPTGVENPERARANYMLHCQGCHGAHGEGSAAAQVPRLAGYLGNFLKVSGGREFIVQVPGSAMAALGDAELAELLNWLLPAISRDQLPGSFAPYSAAEVGELRATPALDAGSRRAALVKDIENPRAEVGPAGL